MNKFIFLFTGFLLLTGIARTQEIKTHDHTVALNFIQIKEQMNYGLVFKGPGLGYAFSHQWENENRILDYEGRIFLNPVWTRDIIAPSFNLVPIRFDYLFKTGTDGKVCVGLYAIMEYNYELYPDLQSGYSFWYTNFSIGCAVTGWFNVKQGRLDLALHATVFGLTSRQPVYDDPYFFDLSLGYIFKFVHQDMQFGSLESYSNTEFELRWTPKPESRLAYAYSFQYYAYGHEPTLKMINQAVKLVFIPKKNK